MKFGYHTSFLKNLLSRVEQAAKGNIRFIDDRREARLEIKIFFSFDGFPYIYGSDIYNKPVEHWFTFASDCSHSRNKRYMSILNIIVNQTSNIYMRLTSTGTAISNMLGFEFSSIEELDMKLTIAGY